MTTPAKRVETVDEWVARHLATAPPLTSTQSELVRRVFRNVGPAAAEPVRRSA